MTTVADKCRACLVAYPDDPAMERTARMIAETLRETTHRAWITGYRCGYQDANDMHNEDRQIQDAEELRNARQHRGVHNVVGSL